MSRARVIVVEDQPLAAKDVEATLEVMDYEVVEIVRTGEEAIDIASREDPDVVLMDIELAGDMDGIEAAQRIQADHDVPIVFLTAHAEPETVGRAKQFGPYGYISKPVDAIELRTAIEVATRKREIDEEKQRTGPELATLARNVAEQLNGPLEAATRELDELERSVDDLAQEPRSRLASARRDLARARASMDGLIAYAEAGDVEVDEPTDADAALDSVLDELAGTIEAEGAEVTADPLPEVLLPRGSTERLLGNLVRDALQHADEEEPEVHVSAREETDEAVLIVQANGEGIPPERRKKVFDLFGGGRTGEELGVGLAVCQRIAEASGGSIWVDAEEGEGSTFFVRLPRVPETDAEPGRPARREA